MNWFCKPHAVCKQCRVHYDPHNDGLPFDDYCTEHRQAHLDKFRRYQKVMAWCKSNWQKFETQVLAEEATQWAAYAKTMGGMANAQNIAMNTGATSPYTRPPEDPNNK